MKEIVFATNNPHKLRELRELAAGRLRILSLDDIGCHEDIPETGATLEENARIKARHVKERYGLDCFADDTGLMVDALGGEPGVLSARYAGPGHDSAANMALLLSRMEGCPRRTARFVTAICLIMDGREEMLHGTVEGEILTAPQGSDGFGYDPVFRPAGHERSFAAMSAPEKNAISHRGRAVSALMKALFGNG